MTISIYGHVTVEQIREKNKVKKKNFFYYCCNCNYIILLASVIVSEVRYG